MAQMNINETFGDESKFSWWFCQGCGRITLNTTGLNIDGPDDPMLDVVQCSRCGSGEMLYAESADWQERYLN